MISNAVCQICGAELCEPRWRLIGVCGAAKCQLAWASRLQARRKAELQMKMLERTRLAEAHRDREILRRGIGHLSAIQPVVVPANLRKIVNLPERRKRAFRNYMMELVSQAAAARVSSANPPPGETAARFHARAAGLGITTRPRLRDLPRPMLQWRRQPCISYGRYHTGVHAKASQAAPARRPRGIFIVPAEPCLSRFVRLSD